MFLDEPLANLDYKLREELREQLPELLAGRGAVVVYATSEPDEALLLGGKTALMDDGAVTQFGPTSEIYRNPENLTAARVFSRSADQCRRDRQGGADRAAEHRSDMGSWSALATDLPDGPYTVAVRPHHVTPVAASPRDVPLAGQGAGHRIVRLGIQRAFRDGRRRMGILVATAYTPTRSGRSTRFTWMPRQCFFFAPDGRLAA